MWVRSAAPLESLSRPYYRWRKEYGGLKVTQAKRMKDLERENARLRVLRSSFRADLLLYKLRL